MKRVEVYLGKNLRKEPNAPSNVLTLSRRLEEVGISPNPIRCSHADYSFEVPDEKAEELVRRINSVQYFCAKVVDA